MTSDTPDDTTPLRRAAVLQVVLEGVALPAAKSELIAYARRQQAPADVLAALEQIPSREYAWLDEIGEAIAPTQPRFERHERSVPRPESGEVPGGAGYLDPGAEPGEIRDEPSILPDEEQLVREPAPAGQGIPQEGAQDRKPRAAHA